MEVEIKIKTLRIKKNISIQKVLEFMGWSNRSVLFKKETGKSKISIEEALKISKLFNEPIEKIFKLNVSKKETFNP